MTTPIRLFLTADRSRLVPEGHAEDSFLFASPGDPVKEADAKRLHLSEVLAAAAGNPAAPPPPPIEQPIPDTRKRARR